MPRTLFVEIAEGFDALAEERTELRHSLAWPGEKRAPSPPGSGT
jgi:hypothetical protein